MDYMVKFWDGTQKVYANLSEAQAAIRKVQGRATLRAVPAGRAA